MATYILLALVVTMCFVYVSARSALATNTTSIDAKDLLKLGQDYNNPLLQLLGIAFANTERKISQEVSEREKAFVGELTYSDNVTLLDHVCRLLECSSWSEWSTCPRGGGEFNLATRVRHCGVNSTLCSYTSLENRNETRTKVCESVFNIRAPFTHCPRDYELVDGEFCLKFINKQQVQDKAVKQCRQDGAHIVNINSLAKSNAVHSLLEKVGFSTSTLYINGRRGSNQEYETSYGQKTSYDNWASGEPSFGSSEKCKVEEGDPRRWWDRECYNTYYSVCEYV